ncbi:hypothetical protein M413DRAFT_346787 [Hebeloma cylindrosporum]|uniref:Secreted protein n=1 Tax=Hebeloma cylindrosporum TaxID=76867 RepID=A0A0C3BU80_HEBCY|nr:hypothetical protein M413DRAFT_346787 [Hebeloma cylindrosporum h7]
MYTALLPAHLLPSALSVLLPAARWPGGVQSKKPLTLSASSSASRHEGETYDDPLSSSGRKKFSSDALSRAHVPLFDILQSHSMPPFPPWRTLQPETPVWSPGCLCGLSFTTVHHLVHGRPRGCPATEGVH